MPFERSGDVGALRIDSKTVRTGISDQRLNQLARHAAPTNFGRDQSVFGHPHAALGNPGQAPQRRFARNMGAVFASLIFAMTSDGNFAHNALLA